MPTAVNGGTSKELRVLKGIPDFLEEMSLVFS